MKLREKEENTFSMIGLTTKNEEKNEKKFFGELCISSSHLQISPVLLQQLVTFPAQQKGWGQGRIPTIPTGELRPCCHKRGVTLSQGYAFTSDAYFLDEVRLKRLKNNPWS